FLRWLLQRLCCARVKRRPTRIDGLGALPPPVPSHSPGALMAFSFARFAKAFTPRFRLRTLFAIVGLAAVSLWMIVELPGWQRWWRIRQARGRISQYERMVAGDGDPAAAPPEIVAILGDSRLQHWGSVHTVASGPGDRLLSFGSDQRFRVWDLATGEQTAVMPAQCCACSLDGRRAFLVNDRNEIVVWDVASGEPSRTLHQESAKPVRCLTANWDGSVVASLGGEFTDTQVMVWKVTSGEVIALWEAATKTPDDGA